MAPDGRIASSAWLLTGILAGVLVGVGIVVGVRAIDGSGTALEAAPAPRFEEPIALDQVYEGDFEHFVGGGVAVLDCNSDDLPDLFLAGGTDPAGLYINRTGDGGGLGFARSDGEWSVTGATGAYPIDIDSDQLTDLVVLRRGENLVLRGMGDCGFQKANEAWQIDGGDDWTVGFSAYWEDGETLPTLAFGNYLEMDDREQCADHSLIRPAGDDSYGEPLTLSPGYCTLSILFSDWARSGTADLRMTNDRHYYSEGQEQLWAMTDAPTEYTQEDGWEHLEIWGMGIASQDLDDDGRPEVFLTSQGDNKLQTLADETGRPRYDDFALAAGATAHRPFTGDTLRPSTAWHAEFDDVNNDGFVDLFITKGNVEAQEDFAAEDPNNLLLGRPGATFEEAADDAGLLDMALSRGGAVADLDLDGDLDVVVVERREPVHVWENSGELVTGGPAGNWLLLDVQKDGANADAVGAFIEIELGEHLITREVTVGGGHASGQSGPIHFGLGSFEDARARITWPDGTRTDWQRLDANQVVSWEKGSPPLPR